MWSLIVVLLDEVGDATPSLDGISISFHPHLFFLQSAMETLYQPDTCGVTIADSYVLEMATVPQVLQEALGGHLGAVVGDQGDLLSGKEPWIFKASSLAFSKALTTSWVVWLSEKRVART